MLSWHVFFLKNSSNFYCIRFSMLELFMILIKTYTLPVYTFVHSIHGFYIRAPYCQSKLLSQKQYKKKNEQVTLVNNLRGSWRIVVVVIFFKYWDKSSQVNGIFLNLSGEGKLAKTKRREQFTVRQLSKDLYLKIIF